MRFSIFFCGADFNCYLEEGWIEVKFTVTCLWFARGGLFVAPIVLLNVLNLQIMGLWSLFKRWRRFRRFFLGWVQQASFH